MSPALGHLGQYRTISTGVDGTGLGDALTLVVDHRADTADGSTGNDDIAELESTVLDKDGHYRAAALVKTRLNDRTLCGTVGIGLEFKNFGQDCQILKQVIDALTGLCGDWADYRIAAPLLADEVILGELLLDALGIQRPTASILFIATTTGMSRGLRVVYGFNGLRHDAVVRRDNEDRDIGDHSASRAHGSESLVTRSVQGT